MQIITIGLDIAKNVFPLTPRAGAQLRRIPAVQRTPDFVLVNSSYLARKP